MMTKEQEDDLIAAIEPDLKRRFREQFECGLMAGYKAALITAAREANNLTSAKAIQKMLADKVAEQDKRMDRDASPDG